MLSVSFIRRDKVLQLVKWAEVVRDQLIRSVKSNPTPSKEEANEVITAKTREQVEWNNNGQMRGKCSDGMARRPVSCLARECAE